MTARASAFVTGATGFLGRFLMRELRRRGWDAVGVGSRDADLTDRRALDPFAGQRFDYIFHLASWTQAGDFCLHHPGEQWLINQQIHTTVLTWWQRHQPQAKLVAIGTSCAYPTDLPLVESNYLAGTPVADLYTYAMTKRMLLVGMRSLERQFGLRHLTVVPSTLYGPDYPLEHKQAHFIFDLMRKILRARQGGEPAVLWGDGHQKREIVHVEDFVDTMLALTLQVDNDLVNIGAGEEYSIRQFAAMICRTVGLDESKVQYDTAGYVGARAKFLDNKKLDRLLPQRRRRPVDEGLAETIAWMAQRPEILKPPP